MEKKTWESYWKSGAKDSFVEGYSYDEELTNPLVCFFQKYVNGASPGSLVLDIGCGAGNNISLYRRAFNCRANNIQFVGIDYAVPAEVASKADFQIIQGNMNKLPIRSNSFAVVSSIFGIEYGTPTSTVTEILRCLTSGGKLVAVCHSSDSVISQRSRETVAFYSRLEELGLFDLVNGDLPNLSIQDVEKFVLQCLRSVYVNIPLCHKYDLSLFSSRLRGVFSQYSATHDRSLFDKSLVNYLQQVIDHKSRLNQQLLAASKVDEMLDMFSKQDSTVIRSVLTCSAGNIGVGICVENGST